MRITRGVTALAFATAIVAACSSGGAASPSPSAAPSVAPTTAAAPSASPSEAVVSPSPSPDACAAANLATKTAGTLTFGTDNPAYPPYFAMPGDGETKTAPWELGDPTNGKGFESAVAYAVADKLGFSKDKVAWVFVPFDTSYAPGDKTFDIDINQISFTPERAQAVDMTDGYYTVNQALVANDGTPITKVTSIAALKDFGLGAQKGTTSYGYITDTIAPSKDPSVYKSNDAAIAGLNAKQIDGIVVDLPTAFYITAAQMKHGVIVGQFPAPTGADAEHFSMVLQKGSPITACVNTALAALKSDGTLDTITQTWLSEQANAPVFQP
jgi:polar amino acid transport system substrate-binding protein